MQVASKSNTAPGSESANEGAFEFWPSTSFESGQHELQSLDQGSACQIHSRSVEQ